jgi:anthranilate synthase component 1
MRKIEIQTSCKQMLADVFTPVGMYLRLRDRFRDTVLLESTDFHAADSSYSFIAVNAIAGMEITSTKSIEFKYPGHQPERVEIQNVDQVPSLLWEFMNRFEISKASPTTVGGGMEGAAKYAQGLFGYTTYDAVQFFESFIPNTSPENANPISLMRYRLYQYVIAINHFRDEMTICENVIKGVESDLEAVESLIYSKDVPVYPFRAKGTETSNMIDENKKKMVILTMKC